MNIEHSYQNFIALSRYARWLPKENRRETWDETVNRYFIFMISHLKDNYNYSPSPELVQELTDAVLNLEVMPSMRALMTAGTALSRDHTAGYNCSFMPVDNVRAFDEAMYILMCGTGLGFSVESKYVDKLPIINEHFEHSNTTIVVDDSKTGWAKAFREVLSMLWQGIIPKWDVSKVRPAGARLKIFGGRASGPGPLIKLFEFCIHVIKNAAGRKLRPIEAHDIMCKIAEIVVVGGVRRSALISLSDLSDQEMAKAKSGAWWEVNGQRALANNSVAFNKKPSFDQFFSEWKSLYDSKSGERGIFNIEAAKKQAAKYGRRDPSVHYGTNPCCVSSDTYIMTTDGPRQISDLKEKAFVAVIAGEKYFAPIGSWVSGIGKLYSLKTIDGHELKLTKEHRIMTHNRGWVQAKDLLVTDSITLADGKASTKLKSLEFVGEEEVWDAEVSGVHAFDANGIYAHNSEIILKPNGFCNLSEVVVRENDTEETLKRKVRLATILGTWQSTLTNFRYLRKIWKQNAEEERLLGVSLTGQFGNRLMSGQLGDLALKNTLDNLRGHSVLVNIEESKNIGINPSAAITCVKPSGTVAQRVGTSAGMHAWHSDYYIRTVRGDKKDPMTRFLVEAGVPHEDDIMKPNDTTVFAFPIKAPDNALTRNSLTAIQHLELWLIYQNHWCEHKPSVTITVKEDEWLEVGAWVWKHFDQMSGVSFLPHTEHTYQQAPYQEVTKEQYDQAVEAFPKHIQWSDLSIYELEDATSGTQELACTNGACEIVDIVKLKV